MNEKIAIITFTGGANYGNRLQNYALQEALKNYSENVYTLNCCTSDDILGWHKFLFAMKHVIKKISGKPHRLLYFKRKSAFDEFNKKYINFSNIYLKNNKAPKKIDSIFDVFVCGSDQIWNTNYKIVRDNINNYLLSFAKEGKKVSFAASFGTKDVNSGYRECFRKELMKFDAISVRENNGVDIVKDLSGRDAVVMPDPTMLLSKQDWDVIAKKPCYVKDGEKYVLTYFLGKKPDNFDLHIKKIQEQKGIQKTINLDIEFFDTKQMSDKETYITSPEEFIWLISNAECVLTDSYHATVFSIIYGTQFCVYERNMKGKNSSIGSRIDTLLEMFGLTEFKDDRNSPNIFPQEYDTAHCVEIFRKRREDAYTFLDEVFK